MRLFVIPNFASRSLVGSLGFGVCGSDPCWCKEDQTSQLLPSLPLVLKKGMFICCFAPSLHNPQYERSFKQNTFIFIKCVLMPCLQRGTFVKGIGLT